uniref:Uncharacterized protein n=1 Tax=Rhizophora mucronata TaxID=61149 RepID=A0A2P2J198_RHIMU
MCCIFLEIHYILVLFNHPLFHHPFLLRLIVIVSLSERTFVWCNH